MKHFDIYPKLINILFIKAAFGHFSEIFGAVVKINKPGKVEFDEILLKDKIDDLEFYTKKDLLITNQEIILKEIKRKIRNENFINLLFFTELIAIISLKIKNDAIGSNADKLLRLFERIGNKEEAMKSIFLKKGKTL